MADFFNGVRNRFNNAYQRFRLLFSASKETVFTDEDLIEYQELSYLTKDQIIKAYDKFVKMSPQFFNGAKVPFLPKRKVMEMPEFKSNPFRDRMMTIFASFEEFMTFDDYLNMMSVFSKDAPLELKIEYAFRLYDFDADDFLSMDDLYKLIDLLKGDNELEESEKKELVVRSLLEGDIDEDGLLAFLEFFHMVERIEDFANTFRIRV